jgi:hypothetical protein
MLSIEYIIHWLIALCYTDLVNRNYLHYFCLQKNLEESKVEKEPDIKTLPSIIFEKHIQYTNDFFDCAQICDNLM